MSEGPMPGTWKRPWMMCWGDERYLPEGKLEYHSVDAKNATTAVDRKPYQGKNP